MAEPAFIYAFDNMGDENFVRLCGLLLASRYRGFLLGGVGPDGGIDGEIDSLGSHWGEWRTDVTTPLGNQIIEPNQVVLFQFKHKVTSRVGQTASRAELLRSFKCSPNKTSRSAGCELHSHLVQARQPNMYVLVTNVEVNSEFRAKFTVQCQEENPDIARYEIIGLDDLVTWVSMQPELRHLYFPSIFGISRFSLRVRISLRLYGAYGSLVMSQPIDPVDPDNLPQPSSLILSIEVLNVGTIPSYVESINFRVIDKGESKVVTIIHASFLQGAASSGLPVDPILNSINSKFGTPIEPGRKQTYNLLVQDLWKSLGPFTESVFPAEVTISDEIGNTYSEIIPAKERELIRAVLAMTGPAS